MIPVNMVALDWRGLATHSFVRAGLKVAATEYLFWRRKSLTDKESGRFGEREKGAPDRVGAGTKARGRGKPLPYKIN
jgi:hypothetical protein